MIFYILIFSFSILFAYLSHRYRHNIFISIMFYMIAAVPLIVAAGYRDITIGSDTNAYPVTVFENRKYFSFSLYGIIEPLYCFLGYITYILHGSFYTLLLITHSIIIGGFFWAFWRLRKTSPLWLSTSFFCFLYYNTSIQISRQALAIAIVFLGFTYLREKKLYVFLLSVIIAFLFHRSAIGAILFIPFFYYNKEKWIQQAVLLGVIITFFMFAEVLSNLTFIQGFDKYESYYNGFYEGKLSYSELLLRITFLLFLFYVSRWKCNKSIILLFLVEFFLNLFQVKSRWLGRIGMPIFILYFYYIPCLLTIKKRMTNQYAPHIIIISFVLLYWWFVFVYGNAGSTVPYTSKILGID